MIEVADITYSYGRKKVLTDVTFEVKKGECVGIVGANGCGKSTLLSILAGVQKPLSGSIRYAGLNPFSDRRLFHRLTGYVPQEEPLIPELSVADNLKLWYGGSREMKQGLQGELCKLLNIEEMLSTRVSKLSGGMKKRVSIACAMTENPAIMMLDEPSAALDLSCKEDMKEYLQVCLKAGTTILLATHEEKELELCDRILILKNGMLEETEKNLRGRALTSLFI